MRRGQRAKRRAQSARDGGDIKILEVSDGRFQRHRRPKKAAGKIVKETFVSAVLGLWERFLTAIARVIVAEGHSHHP